MAPARYSASSQSPHSLFSSSSKIKRNDFLICLSFFSVPFFLFVITVKYQTTQTPLPLKTHIDMLHDHKVNDSAKPLWYDIIAKGINGEKIKVGLVNINDKVYDSLHSSQSQSVETVSVNFDRVNKNLRWEDFYPEWIDEDGKWGQPKCPEMPMPKLKNYLDLNVVVARIPCEEEINGDDYYYNRDVFRLQINLVVANVAVKNGWMNRMEKDHRKVYVVFVGPCGPMEEIFRCDDLIVHQDGFWVYNPNLWRLKHKTLMPFGSCQIAPAYAETGKERWKLWRNRVQQKTSDPMNPKNVIISMPPPRWAYVTMLHSSEAYVCGAIALAQSIIQTNKNILKDRDLVLLTDNSIGPNSITALKSAGWKIKLIERISNPFAKKDAYNEWNYSKLRIWELTMYEKIMFIDADLLVLKSIDEFFTFPQLSAAPNEKTLFNSGLMVIEPSKCMFESMMKKIPKVKPYNGGDQGFLNEIFTWWHRMPSKLNRLKTFRLRKNGDDGVEDKHEIAKDLYTIHYLGLKPWMCYRDYDCNWDMRDHHIFASDSAHWRWWRVYDAMSDELKGYCGISPKMNERIMKRRREAMNASLYDGHWKIQIKDPRKKDYYVDYNITVD